MAPARRCRTAGAEGDGSAAPGAQNRHGGAPRGERPASWQMFPPQHSIRLHCGVDNTTQYIALGYRRNAGAGTWTVRVADGGAEWTEKIALADDFEGASP